MIRIQESRSLLPVSGPNKGSQREAMFEVVKAMVERTTTSEGRITADDVKAFMTVTSWLGIEKQIELVDGWFLRTVMIDDKARTVDPWELALEGEWDRVQILLYGLFAIMSADHLTQLNAQGRAYIEKNGTPQRYRPDYYLVPTLNGIIQVIEDQIDVFNTALK